MPRQQHQSHMSGLSNGSSASVAIEQLASSTLPEGATFRPAIGLSNPHLQTMYGVFRPARPVIRGTIQRKVRFADGDVAVLHDDQPDGWSRGDYVALLMHGLAGCHQSGYMARICGKLMDRGVRVFRMDHRGCGAGRMLAENPYNAGRIDDVASAVALIERLCPESPLSVAGFSLSGNLLLRYLGDRPDELPLSLFRAVAVCPPIDLQHSVEELAETAMGRRYDWYFARQLVEQIMNTPQWRDDLPLANVTRPPRRLIDFDELYTAPASGFDSAADYYEFSSAKSHLSKSRVHTVVLAAGDDPLVSSKPWSTVTLPANVSLCLTKHGGHLGFVGRNQPDSDNRWMDWRVVDWLLK